MPKIIKDDIRQLATRKCDSYGNYEIHLQGGGQIPKRVGGIYTSKEAADRALANYLATQGIEDEKRKAREAIKAITELDHTYDEV